MLLSIIKYKENVLKDSLSKKYLNIGLISTPNIRMYRFQPPIDRGLGGTQYASVFNSACQTQALSLNDNDTSLCDIVRYLGITVDDKLKGMEPFNTCSFQSVNNGLPNVSTNFLWSDPAGVGVIWRKMF